MWDLLSVIKSIFIPHWLVTVLTLLYDIFLHLLFSVLRAPGSAVDFSIAFSQAFCTGINAMTFLVNRGIPFAPLLACWMFIVASIVVAMPGLKRILTFRFTRDFAELICRLTFPVLAYHFVWVPVNQFFCIKLNAAGMGMRYRAQWLPFLSGMMAVLVVLGTIIYKNPCILIRLGFRQNMHVPRPVSVPTSPRKLQTLTPVRLTTPNPRKEWRNDGPWIIALTPARRVLPMRQHKLTRHGTIYG